MKQVAIVLFQIATANLGRIFELCNVLRKNNENFGLFDVFYASILPFSRLIVVLLTAKIKNEDEEGSLY
ncbi:MAG: hypothetical protein HUK11_08845 [Muribaculaceae bacterium]|nr:hypothetical protein [Muribaculaceae bacterium]